MEKKETLDCWAIVELMGHQRIAGRVTERNVAGTQMLQVDVPALGDVPGYSRLLGGSAIYAINPCDEETATGWARSIASSASPVVGFDGKQVLDRLVERRLAALPQAGGADATRERQCQRCGSALDPQHLNPLCDDCLD